MKLTAIKLQGFKSFATATVFPVEEALTAIIGPNGCGKSNIIDAVRWVLGENAHKQLRGHSASDVIFAGTGDRKPATWAQVELVFDNSAQKISGPFAAFDEINVSRKLTNNGASLYQINQKIVRRRDVVELLQSVGVSARSYAVIEQGMIGRIIEAKPEEIRGFIEESAGIAIYKSRRRETEERMGEVEGHLQRHGDRLDNLANQRERLAGEANTARHYQELQGQLEGHSHRLQSFQLHQLRQGLAAIDGQMRDTAAQLEKLELSLSRGQNRELEEALRRRMGEFQQSKGELDNLQGQLAQLQRQEEGLRMKSQFSQEKSQEQQQTIHRLEKEISQQQEQAEQLRSQLRQLEAAIHGHGPQLVQLQQLYQEALQRRERQRAQQQERGQRLEQLQQRQRRIKQEFQQLQRQEQGWQERLKLLELQRAEPLPTLDFDEEQLLALEEERLLLEEQQQEERAKGEEMQAQEAAARRQLEERERQFNHITGQLQALGQLQEVKKPHFPGLEPLLKQITVADRWQPALENHLAARLTEAYSEQPEHWAAALQAKVALVGPGQIPPQWAAIVQGAVDLDFELAGLQPLEKHDAAISAAVLSSDVNNFSLDGTLINTNSLNPAAGGGGLLAQRRLREELEAQRPTLEQELNQARAQQRQAQTNLQAQRELLATLAKRQQQLEQTVNQLKHQQQLQRQQLEHQKLLKNEQSRQMDNLRQDLQGAAEQRELLQEELLTVEENILLNQSEGSFLEDASLEQAQLAYQQAEGQQRERQQQSVRLQTQLQALHDQVDRQNLAIIEQRRQLAEQENHRENLGEELLALNMAKEENAAQLLEQRQILEERQRTLDEVKRQLAEHEKLLQNERQQQQILQERQQLHEQQRQQLAGQADNLVQEMAAEGREALSFSAAEEPDLNQLQGQIRQLRQQIQGLGAVNLSAIGHYEEINKEYEELAGQVKDIRDSLAMLQQAIQELDTETKERLTRTMAVVNEHFALHLAQLFQGGQGSLRWTDGDILTAGVQINVALAGKKMRNLSALSGGEKALAALSLVFALFRLNPAPFCLLDEVDAPLDEANVGRLCTLLEDMSQHTQLVVITHHKRTMESCRRLIGVTMSEPGVSRLVGVQLQ